jgi:hypothetical protein
VIAAAGGLRLCYVIDALSFGAALYGVARLPAVPPASPAISAISGGLAGIAGAVRIGAALPAFTRYRRSESADPEPVRGTADDAPAPAGA